jgi:hypothetical protein
MYIYIYIYIYICSAGKLEVGSPFEASRWRLEVNKNINLQQTEWNHVNWIQLAQNVRQYWVLADTVPVSAEGKEFLH